MCAERVRRSDTVPGNCVQLLWWSYCSCFVACLLHCSWHCDAVANTLVYASPWLAAATCSRPDKLCLRHRYIGKSKSKLLLPEIRYRSISWCVKLCLICGKVIGAICRSYSTDNAKHWMLMGSATGWHGRMLLVWDAGSELWYHIRLSANAALINFRRCGYVQPCMLWMYVCFRIRILL